MRHFLRGPRQYPLVACLTVLATLVVSGGLVNAAAHWMGHYNLTGVDPTYGPYSGSIWAANYTGNLQAQRIQAENYGITWSQQNAANVRNGYSKAGPVFHVGIFNPANPSENCQAPFSYTGWFSSNHPNATASWKSVWSCYYSGYANEVRILWPASATAGETGYRGEAEFRLNNGDLYFRQIGKVANDIYFINSWGWSTDRNTGVTWCFKEDGSEYRC